VVIIVDANGQPVADPVPLDADGVPVAVGADFHYVDFDGYDLRDWGPAGELLIM
jgi:hypothetical protein